jgi:predicted extracellular nuclease
LTTLGVAFLMALAGVLPIGTASADVDPCTSPFTPTYSIQGSGPAAAITGTVTTQGVVVGDFEGTAAASGFYLQDAPATATPPPRTGSSSSPGTRTP